jgi:hypothetical protein
LDIGEVLSDTFAVIGRTIVVLANLAVLFVAVPAVIRIAGVALTPVSPIFSLVNLIGSVSTLVGMLFAYPCIFQVAMQDLHGQSISTDAIIKTATRKFWALLGLAILLLLGVAVGSLLLIVPGVILALAWSVSFPALVLEDRGVFAAFRRSADLTRGKRWSIFLLFFLVSLVVVIIELVLFAIFGGLRGLVSSEQNMPALVLAALLSVITVPFGAVLSTALFNQLRGKAGYGAEEVAEVFA